MTQWTCKCVLDVREIQTIDKYLQRTTPFMAAAMYLSSSRNTRNASFFYERYNNIANTFARYLCKFLRRFLRRIFIAIIYERKKISSTERDVIIRLFRATLSFPSFFSFLFHFSSPLLFSILLLSFFISIDLRTKTL